MEEHRKAQQAPEGQTVQDPCRDQGAENQEAPVKSLWQQRKESWYDRVPLTVKQLDYIIWGATIALIIVCILIALDARGVF